MTTGLSMTPGDLLSWK